MIWPPPDSFWPLIICRLNALEKERKATRQKDTTMTTCAPPAGSHEHYDSVSRAVHWLMFLLFAWIYCSAITHYLASDSTLDKWLWPFHKPVGLLLLVLLILRAGWRLLNQHRRPLSISRFAAAG
ncbi:cytochrome b/b6 domain-containing protein, partial [Pseudomonas fluorescens]|uniref:cytochrome b/b6 domain-containing protein n=1 Tax=Pseudomonas fluorescens TaxID=294 RepID=UPI001E2C9BA5